MNFAWLKVVQIDNVIDIGANVGQFAEMARQLWPDAQIYSIEALPQALSIICQVFATDDKWKGFCRVLSDKAEKTYFNVSSFSQSSSLLTMAPLHKEEWDISKDHFTSAVDCITLDDLVESAKINTTNLLVKLDVQGAELKVINGGVDTISRASACYIETSFRELYVGQPLFGDIVKRMDELGFKYFGNAWNVLYSKNDGTPLEEDSLFVRKDDERFK